MRWNHNPQELSSKAARTAVMEINPVDVEKYTEITFKSTAVKKTGEQTYDVTGNLTMHGVTKPLTVKLERTGAGPGMKGEYRGGCETTFEVKRSDFGMNTMIGPLGDEVRLTFSLEGIRQ